MRICGGEWRGRRLATPKDQRIRPTAERVREALFHMLGESVLDAQVLDLFSGSGALGLEALSRGAQQCHFVEKHAAAHQLITENIRRCGAEKQTTLIKGDALSRGLRQVEARGEAFHLITLDPPYDRGLAERTLAALEAASIWAEETLIVVEHEKDAHLPPPTPHWEQRTHRVYGSSALTIWRRDEAR